MEIKNILCLKCNNSLLGSNLKRYCRTCIITIKNDRIDTQDTDKICCKKCSCFKANEDFRNILLTCKQCRTRKEHRINKDNTNKDIIDGLEEEQHENQSNKKSITKVNYKSKLQTILIYLKDKYAITETLDQLADMDINLLEETNEEAEKEEEQDED